eukprot:TRINITY_DN6440_c0_g1_i1.p1 TRINITY_DN6440_c0_g1~~TRINITY_DN6440_c0_g1_i1.p1  ORF type:complete len:421 (+),score=27.54 TRINITY_DN6440_c0_g1_i1:96-1358(+)
MNASVRKWMAGLFLVDSSIFSFVIADRQRPCPPRTVPFPSNECQPIDAAKAEATEFLRQNMPHFDTPNIETLFNGGVAHVGVDLALKVRTAYNWAAEVPREIFNDAVLPYASVNEARTNWRQLLIDRLEGPLNFTLHSGFPLAMKHSMASVEGNSGLRGAHGDLAKDENRDVPQDAHGGSSGSAASLNEFNSPVEIAEADNTSSAEAESDASLSLSLEAAATRINEFMWRVLGPISSSTSIVFKSEQTPKIFDPLSTLLFGYASCTGISVTYVAALRAFGIPARVVGTPGWLGDARNGNHNWVEVWLGPQKGWSFIEGGPAGPGEKFEVPCDKWFCNRKKFPLGSGTRRPSDMDASFSTNSKGTQVFATAWDRQANKVVYPMAWDLSNRDIAGVDRTDYYHSVCSKCGSDEGQEQEQIVV